MNDHRFGEFVQRRERDRHEELLAEGGKYARLCASSFLDSPRVVAG